MRFLDIFNEIQKGNYALTDEAIYSSIRDSDELIPIYGGNKDHNITERKVSINAKTKKGMPITVFSGEGIIISLDGSAGSMTYKNGEKFALNHHAGFITVKDNAKNKVYLEFFALSFQNFYRSLSVSEGSKTLSLEQIYSEEIELPSLEMQSKILDKLNAPYRKLSKLSLIKHRYINLLEKEVSVAYSHYQARNVPISEHVSYMSGNSGLTEEFIYHTLQTKGEKYTVLSSATEDRTMMGKIPMCIINSHALKVFEKKEGLLVTRNGKAGRTRFLYNGKYTINDHAYILYIKESSPYKLDLRWLSIQYKPVFLSYSSSSDNGTWNMTGFFKHTKIDIPSIEEQIYVVRMYEQLERRISTIQDIENQFYDLINKEISIA